MNKKIGIVILIILLAGIIAIPLYIKYEQKSKEEIIEPIEVNLISLEGNALSRMEIKDKSALILKKQDENWTEPEYKELIYNKAAVEEMVKAAYSLKSKQVIRNVQDLATYGINENSRMITMYDETNNPYTMKLGHYTSDKKGLYIQTSSDKVVYLVDSEEAKPLFQKRDDLLDKKMMLPQMETVNTLQISKKDEPDMLIKKNTAQSSEADAVWTLESYFKTPHLVKTEDIETIINEITSFEKGKFIGAKKDTDISTYELDAPYMSVTVNGKWVIKFGKKENDSIYFIYSGEPYIYTMSAEKTKVLNEIKPISLIKKQVYFPEIFNLKQIELSNPQQSLVLDLKKQTAEDGAEHLTSSAGETIFDEAKTSEILSLIEDNVCIEAQLQNPEIEQKEERKAEITIIYHYDDNTTKTIELIPYDTNFYILRFDDTIEFAVGKEKVMSMFNTLNEDIKSGVKETAQTDAQQ